MLRSVMKDAIFSEPQYSTDNAMGVAVLAHRLLEG
jgi:N6-L-threonylcarbamoyladenine synthase